MALTETLARRDPAARPIAPRRRWRPRKGAFPLFDRDRYLAGETVQALDAGRARKPSPRTASAMRC